MSAGMTPSGRAACDAFWEAVRGDLAHTGDGWDWAMGSGVGKGWTLASEAGCKKVAEERDRLLGLLDEATRIMLNLGTRPAEVNRARQIREEAGLP